MTSVAFQQGLACGAPAHPMACRRPRRGLPQDDAQAVQWYRKAVHLSHSSAYAQLREMGEE
jgi:TPR repeat protein